MDEISLASELTNATSDVIRNASELLSNGISVFPVPFASKKPALKWKMFTHNRLIPEHAKLAFQMPCNLGVVGGKISGNLMFIDAETEEAFDEHLSKLQERQIPIYAIRSGGAKRGGHFYVRVKDGVVQSVASGKMRDAEIRSESHYVLGAYSTHPTSRQLYLPYAGNTSDEPPIVSASVLDWFVDRDNKPIVLAVASRTGYPLPASLRDHPRAGFLSSNTRWFLSEGATPGSRNASLFKAACDMFGSGFTHSEIENIAGDMARKSGLDDQEMRQTIRSAVEKPRTPSRQFMANGSNGASSAEQELRILIGTYASFFRRHYLWNQRSTDRRIFEAIAQRLTQHGMYSNGILAVSAASRQVAELASCTRATIRAGLTRLQDAKIICHVYTDPVSGTFWWILGETVSAFCNEHPEFSMTDAESLVGPMPQLYDLEQMLAFAASVETSEVPESGLPQDSARLYQWLPQAPNLVDNGLTQQTVHLEDLLERGALGAVGLGIFRQLIHSVPSSIKEIAAGLGVQESQVASRLRNGGVLRASGLVVKVGAKEYRADAVNLSNRIGQALDLSGTSGKAEKRRNLHARDRSALLLRHIQEWQERNKRQYTSIVEQPTQLVDNFAGALNLDHELELTNVIEPPIQPDDAFADDYASDQEFDELEAAEERPRFGFGFGSEDALNYFLEQVRVL